MKGNNEIILPEGGKVKITVDHDEGYLNSLHIEGDIKITPAEALEKLQRHMEFAHMTPVAIFTRLRFFLLKNNVTIENIDSHTLADAIADVK